MVGRNNLPQKVVWSAAKIGKYQAAATLLKKKESFLFFKALNMENLLRKTLLKAITKKFS